MEPNVFSIKLVTTTIAKELISILSNLLVALFIARQFEPANFLTYTSILFIISSFVQINRGIQYAVVENGTNFQVEKSSPKQPLYKFALIQMIIWVLITPLLARLLNLPFNPTLVAGIAIPITICSSWVSGYFQSTQRFREWQTWLALSTILQIPLTVLAVYFGLGMSFYIVFNFLSTLITSTYFIFRFKKTFFSFRIKLNHPFGSGLYIAVLFLNYNLPILILKKIVQEQDLGKYTLITYPMGILVGIISVFGSFALTKSILKHKTSSSKYLLDWRHFAFIFSIMFSFGIFMKLFSPIFVPLLLSNSYGTNFSYFEIAFCAIAYSCWGMIHWLAQSQMHRINVFSTSLQTLILAIEMVCLIIMELHPLQIFLIHFVCGISGAVAFVYSINRSEYL